MKTLALLVLASLAAGCATLGALPANSGTTASSVDAPTLSPPDPIASSSDTEDTGPRLIIPATGGAPVIGIPLGGDLYLPVTGGTPVIGISTGP